MENKSLWYCEFGNSKPHINEI